MSLEEEARKLHLDEAHDSTTRIQNLERAIRELHAFLIPLAAAVDAKAKK
jgi:hypothetical protein